MPPNPLHLRRAACALGLAAVTLSGACAPKDNTPLPPDASATDAAAPPDASATGGGDDQIRPVYPLKVTPDPQAARLCEALHELPERRKAACCAEPPRFTITAECTRTLSFALQERSVSLAAADVDRCVDALGATYEGCGWVGPNPVRVPDACRGLLKGAVAAGGVCRSSLDCAAGDHCRGAGPTRLGTCAPPLPARSTCELSIDTLAAHTRQDDAAAQHPECAGYCMRHKCFDAVPPGGDCKVSPECGAGRACVQGKCADTPLPTAGQPCPGAACAGDARCVQGQCVAPRREGEVCTVDSECRGGCARPDAGAAGRCEKRCTR